MTILSITFHVPEILVKEWDQYSRRELTQMADNLLDVEKYILSDVESDMISEGKNTNLLLIFEDERIRTLFLQSEFENIADRIEKIFGEQIMIFKTLLNGFSERV